VGWCVGRRRLWTLRTLRMLPQMERKAFRSAFWIIWCSGNEVEPAMLQPSAVSRKPVESASLFAVGRLIGGGGPLSRVINISYISCAARQ
jgi:hypothetical protein